MSTIIERIDAPLHWISRAAVERDAVAMHVTVTTEDDAIVTVDVDPATVVENLKAILEAETDVPTREQVLLFNGGELANDDVLSSKNVGEGDLLMLLRKR